MRKGALLLLLLEKIKLSSCIMAKDFELAAGQVLVLKTTITKCKFHIIQ